MFARSEAEIRDQLAMIEDADIGGVCRVRGVSLGTTRAETIETLIASKVTDVNDAVQDSKQKPASRKSFAGAPKTVRASTFAKESKPRAAGGKSKDKASMEAEAEDPRLLNAAEFQAHVGQSSPAPWPLPNPLHGATHHNIGTPARPSASAMGSLSPEIEAARQRAATLRLELTKSHAEKSNSEVTNEDLMDTLHGMIGKMALKEDIETARLETLKELRSELVPLQEGLVRVDNNSLQALNETKMLHERLVTVEQGSVKELDRVGKLESQISELQGRLKTLGSARGRSNDGEEVRKCVVCKGFKAETAPERVKCIDAFMEQHFKEVKYACVSHEVTGGFQNQKMTDTSYVLFFDKFTADAKLKEIKADECNLKWTTQAGDELKIVKRKTKLEKRRNYCLIRASEILCERHAEADVDIKWSERKAQVKGKDAFKQNRTDERGDFCGEFSFVRFTDR